MRVVVTCDWFLRYAGAQCASLARAGAEVFLLCRDHSFEFHGDVSERQELLDVAGQAGAEIVVMPGRIRDPTAAPRLAAIRKRIASFRPDVIHVQQGVDPRVFALLPNVPTVMTIHDPKPHPGQEKARFPPKRWLDKRLANTWRSRARSIIVHSERLRAQLNLRAHQSCFVVPHGVDVLAEPLPCPPVPTVGFFGQLKPYKGLDVLAQAMPRVWDHRPEVLLKVAGAGPSELPLVDRRVAVQRGYLPEAAIDDFFLQTSLAVLPYTEASQTGVGSQAVGYGVPVVATRVGGLPDLTLDPTYLVDPGDDVGLAEAILRHVDDPAEIRARVLAELAAPRSWDAAATKTLEVYEQLVGTNDRDVPRYRRGITSLDASILPSDQGGP